MVLRENLHKLSREGTHELTFQGDSFGAIINQTKTRPQIILMVSFDKVEVMHRHWKRILPAVLKALPVEEIVEEESPVTQIARMASQIHQMLDDMVEHYRSSNS